MTIIRFQDTVLLELDGTETSKEINRAMAEELDRWWKQVGPAIEAYHRFLRSADVKRDPP